MFFKCFGIAATLWSAAVLRRFGGKRECPFRSQLRRRSKSGGAPPHSTTQVKLCAANDVPCNSLKSATNSSRDPRTRNHALVFKLLGMTRYPADDSFVP